MQLFWPLLQVCSDGPHLHVKMGNSQESEDVGCWVQLMALMRVDVPQHDSDSIIPPKAPHSFVPFSQAPSSRSAPPSLTSDLNSW